MTYKTIKLRFGTEEDFIEFRRRIEMKLAPDARRLTFKECVAVESFMEIMETESKAEENSC